MPEWFTAIAAVVALGSGVFAAVNGYRTMKRTSPFEEAKKENKDRWDRFYRDKWDGIVERIEAIEDTVQHVDSERTRLHFKEINDKLDNDNRRIKTIIETSQSQQRFLFLLLESQQQTLIYLSEGNHNKEALREVSDKIQKFLLKEATKMLDYE